MNSSRNRKASLRIALLSLTTALAACLWWISSSAQQTTRAVATVSAASYSNIVAPEEIVAGFGAGLAAVTREGTDTDAGTPGVQLPTLLAGTSVEVNGRSAGLLFISLGQINYVVPAGLDAGRGQVIVRGERGGIVAAGEIEIRVNAPAIFTANADGQGVPAGAVLRVRANGAQSFEDLARFDQATGKFQPRPIDLGPPGERVFLLLFLTGARRVERASDTRILIGGAEFIPAFIGAAPGFIGLEQVNFELPRGLNGRVALALAAIGYPTSNICEVEAAPPVGSPPRISGLNRAQALAGERLEIAGSGFAATRAENEVLIADANNKLFNAQIEDPATTTSLRVIVPFGAGSGNLIVRTPRGESAFPFTLRTSVSGIIQAAQLQQNGQTTRTGIRGVTVRAFTSRGTLTATTNDDGSFLLADVPPAASTDFEIDGRTTTLPYPNERRKLRVNAGRDNQFGEYIELRQITGVGVPTTATGELAHEPFSTPASANARENVFSGQTGQVVFESNGSTATFPDGTRVNELRVTTLDPGRTPADLPAGQFSSTLVQLTPFGARLAPGGKLTFPNTDGLPANSTATLFRFDQTANSATLGRFVPAGSATVSADGQRIETARNAVVETTYYFVSIPRALTTIYGSVTEEDNTPARGALVQVRGQSIFALTDQNGAFILANVPLVGANQLTLEVSYLRPDGTVDRTERGGVRPNVTGLTFVSPPIVLPGQGRTRAPVILAPKTLAITAGQTSDFSFLAYARVAGQTLRGVTVTGASFASVISNGNDRYTLRLAPAANVTGTFTLTLTATDSQSLRTDEAVVVEVRAPNNPAPVAANQSVTTDEDTPVNLTLAGSNGNIFRVVTPPQRGTLSGTPPNLRYTPEANYNGADGFTFTVSNGATTSAPATVALAVRAVNDAPRLDVAATYTTNIGTLLNFVINGVDVDAGQRLTLTATGLPAGATITQTTATSWLFDWTPKFDQLGSYTVNLTLRDDGSPVLSDSRAVTIVVDAKWAGTSQVGASSSYSFAVLGNSLFAGTRSGVYGTTDNGVSWTAVNNGLGDGFVFALTVKDNVLFAGITNSGVYRTTDNGASWTAVNNGLGNRSVHALTVKDNALFAGTDGGVYRTTDNGASWTAINSGLGNQRVNALTVKDNALFAGIEGGGVYRTTDNGASWTAVNNGLADQSTVRALTGKDNALFAGTFNGVYRTTDNGASWIAVNSGLGNLVVLGLTVKDNALFAGTGSSVYRTTDNGASWTAINSGLGGRLVYDLTVKDNALFAGTLNGVYRLVNNGVSWTEVNGGFGGQTVYALTAKDNALFAGTTGTGVYRTTDNGVSWTAVNSGLGNQRVNALTVKDNALFVGTDGGVYRTTDNGANWTAVNNGLGGPSVYALTVKDNALFAGTNGGVYRTTDNGVSWTAVNSGLGNLVVRVLTVRDNALFAGTEGNGVYRTTDNGANWAAVNSGLGNRSVYALAVKENLLFAGTAGNGVYRTTDNGANWAAVNSGLGNRGAYALAVKENLLFAGIEGEGVYRTTDNGASWTAINSGLGRQSVYALTVKDNALFAGTQSGVYFLAESATTWTESNAGLTNRFINAATLSSESFLVGTFGGGVFRSADKGQSWSPANVGLTPAADVRAFTPSGNGVLAGLAGEGVYFSNDQGRNWSVRNAGLTNLLVNALAGDGATVYAGTNGGVHRSGDGGANWVGVNTGLTRSQVLSLAVSGGAVYAGTDNGLFRSTNQGGAWTAVNTGLSDLYIVALGIAPDGTTLLAGTSSGLFRSTNQGQSWTRVTQGLPERVVALTFAQQGRRLLAGTVNGFFVSEDNGASWRQVNGGLLTLQVGALAVDGETVLAGTRSGGVFVSRLP